MRDSIIINKSMNLSKDIISLYKELVARNEYVISKQLLKSGTSIGANIREASYAESKLDFIHKFSISLKECSETLYWLELIAMYQGTEEIPLIGKITDQCHEILKLLRKSINTCKNGINTNKEINFAKVANKN